MARLDASQTSPADSGTTLAVMDVSVVDVLTGEVRPNQTVLIVDGRIAEVGDSAVIKVVPGAEILRAAGRYLVPGLWDMHSHGSARSLGLNLGNGVTSVRDLWGSADLLTLRDRIATGEVEGPRILATLSPLDGDDRLLKGVSPVPTVHAVDAALDGLQQGGADFVKVHSLVSEPVFRELVRGARERGLPVVGHVPFAVDPLEAAAGLRTIEHLTGMTLACSSEGDRIRAEMTTWLSRPDATIADLVQAFFYRHSIELLETQDEERCRRFIEANIQHATFHTPTLVVLRGWSVPQDRSYLSDPRRKYGGKQRDWDSVIDAVVNSTAPEDLAGGRSMYELQLLYVKRLHERGVKLLVGTDVGSHPSLLPGFSVHDELELLVNAGVPPLGALRAATLHPAEATGLASELGSITRGKKADLLLLSEDPLDDIRNIREIVAVVRAGRLLDRSRLDRLLAGA